MNQEIIDKLKARIRAKGIEFINNQTITGNPIQRQAEKLKLSNVIMMNAVKEASDYLGELKIETTEENVATMRKELAPVIEELTNVLLSK